MGEATDEMTVYLPEYGTLRRAIEYGLFYVVVDQCTRLLVWLMSGVSVVEPYILPLKIGSAIALWAMLALVIAFELRRQTKANPFDGVDLEELRPSQRRLALAGGASALGVGAIATSWTAVAHLTTDSTAAMKAALEAAKHATSGADVLTKAMGVLGTDIGSLVLLGVGVVLLAYGLDRIVIGFIREAQYRRY